VVAPEFVPQLVHSDKTSRSVVLEYIKGERFTEGTTPSQEDINQAVTFMRLLNRDLETGKDLVTDSAAEGFLRITEHLKNVDQRLERMSIDHLPANVACEARWFIEVARKRLNTLQERTEQLLSQGRCPDALDPREQSVSPSDFGFHNAIRHPKGVRFFDFEFAGWDDPVKAVSDFDLQPKVPIKPRAQALAKATPAWTEMLQARYEVLFPILQLKWACIIVSPLDPSRWTQMTKIDLEQISEPSIQAKLLLVRAYLPKN
jgi:hypothetical protein